MPDLSALLDGLPPSVAQLLAGGIPQLPNLRQFANPFDEDDEDVLIELPDPPLHPLLLTVRLDLDHMKPPVWRRLELRGDLTLDAVHGIIQVAMGWENYHLHRFWAGRGDGWGDPYFVNESDHESGVHEDEVRLDQVLRAPKDRLVYTYDFGDDWRHRLVVESVRPATEEDVPARCLKGRGACPPEDCGGVWRYAEIVAAFEEDPTGATLDAELVEWLPEGFDPNHFDVDEVNEDLTLASVSLAEVAGLIEEMLPDVDLTELVSPAIMSLVSKLNLSDMADLAALTAPTDEDLAADPDDPGPVLTEADVVTALRPFRLMLDLADGEGIPLTPAGWMRPAVVEHIVAELDLPDARIGAANRENQTSSVAGLRRLCQDMRLLRKNKGHLVRTPLGRQAAADPRVLWEALVDAVTPDGEGAESDTITLYLLHVGHGHDVGWSTWDRVTAWLTRAGWTYADGTPIDRYDARYAAEDASDIVTWLGDPARRFYLDALPATPAQRVFAQQALSGTGSAAPGADE